MRKSAARPPRARPGLEIRLAGGKTVRLERLFLDFTGTLARDGKLLPGVAARLRRLARALPVAVLTADTCGTARRALAGLPVEVRLVRTGADKARLARRLGAATAAAIGNGRNDLVLMRAARLAVAVVGPEGAAAELLGAADVVVTDVRDALDLLLRPLRLRATLRD